MVYPENYRSGILNRFERLPEQSWPLFAKVAALPDWQDYREWIERTVERLHVDDREKLGHLLRQKDNFLHTFGELVTGDLFLDAGATIRYELQHDLGDGAFLTPDWTCHYYGVTFICDVFTAGLLDERAEYEQYVNDLVRRLSTLKAPFTVVAQIPFTGTFPDAKGTAARFAKWIREAGRVGEVWREGVLTIEIVGTSSEHVLVMAVEPLHEIPVPESIRANIREKGRKYAVLKLPFIVAAVKDHRANVPLSIFEDAVLGDLVYKSVRLPTGRFIEGDYTEPNGAFHSRPALSAAMWINPFSFSLDKVLRVIENANAVLPLPPSFINSLQSQTHQRRTP
jgi:hypothetical protein